MNTTQEEELTLEQLRDLLKKRDIHPYEQVLQDIMRQKGGAAQQEELTKSLKDLLEHNEG